MADNDVDSGQPEGTAGSPNSAGSQGKGDSSGSVDAQKLQTAIEALIKRQDEIDARTRALQGDKDRGVTKARQEVDDLKRKFAEIEKLKKSGLDEDTAFDELSFREDVRSLRQEISKLNPAQPQAAGNGEKLAVDVAKVLADYQLDGNDPEVVEKVLKGNYSSPEQAELAALKLAYRRANSTTPSPAASTALAGRPAVPANVEELTNNYKKDMLAARGKPSELDAIKAKYQKLGVNIHEVVFS